MNLQHLSRREWLATSFATGAASLALRGRAAEPLSGLLIAPFRFDVTPPVGHPLCGGWIKRAVDCVDELEAIGFVLLGAGEPIVICAVDWTGILNEAHVAWRAAMAEAAGTTPDRVAVQCVHQHDAPFVCLHAEKLACCTRRSTGGKSRFQPTRFDWPHWQSWQDAGQLLPRCRANRAAGGLG